MIARRIAVLAGLGLLSLGWQPASIVLAPSRLLAAQPQDNFTLEGKISEKSAGKLTVTSGENMLFHVLYNDKTEIRKKDGSPGTAQDLHIGVTISVAGDLADSGEITARTIDIQGEGSEKQ